MRTLILLETLLVATLCAAQWWGAAALWAVVTLLDVATLAEEESER